MERARHEEKKMNLKRIALLLVFADFLGLTAYTVYQVGYVEFFRFMTGNIVGIQIFADLVIALGLVAIWMINDARERGVSPVPYLMITLFLGSLGPLAYLIRRTAPAEERAPALAAQSH
jgi:hypothetical protein